MTDDFLGPNSNTSNNNIKEQGYFAVDRPGTGGNSTTLSGWWPSDLDGWRLPVAFPSNWRGGLRRRNSPVSNLPSVMAIQALLQAPNFHDKKIIIRKESTKMHM